MTRKPRLYLAGPMTGLPEHNYPQFHTYAHMLRQQGAEVVNPAETDLPDTAEWLDFMRAGVAGLVTCDGVAVLPDWEESRGAFIEVTLAKSLGLHVHSVSYWLNEGLEPAILEKEFPHV